MPPAQSTLGDQIDARVWPLAVLALLLSLGCSVSFSSFNARIVNESSGPVVVEYTGSIDGREVEQLSAQIPPGGEFERRLTGRDVRAAATIQRPEGTMGPLGIEFTQGLPECVVKDFGDGITLQQRPAPPKDPQ